MANYTKPLCIEVYSKSNSQFLGYVKSVSYDTGRFSMTTNRRNAKKYKTEYELQCDIDVTSVFTMNKGYYLMYGTR